MMVDTRPRCLDTLLPGQLSIKTIDIPLHCVMNREDNPSTSSLARTVPDSNIRGFLTCEVYWSVYATFLPREDAGVDMQVFDL